MAAALKPCPFCGAEPWRRTYNGKGYIIECPCGAESGTFDTPQEAIEAWNRRANERTDQTGSAKLAE